MGADLQVGPFVLQRRKYNSETTLTRMLVGAVLLCLVGPVAAAQTPDVWREAPAYLALFAPSGPRAAAYRIYVTPLDLQTVLKQVSSDPAALHPPGSWLPIAQLPSDAFGQTGAYDRSRLARLYGATRATVARGPRANQTWTLISPYPNGDMRRLEPGTLLIVMDLGRTGAP